MKKYYLIILIFSTYQAPATAQGGIPNWFVHQMEYNIGVWHTDNSVYKSDEEPMESYALEWNWNETKSGLVGKLYGFVNGEKTQVFWDLLMYWDFKQQAGALFQIGISGTTGYGYFEYNESRSESKLNQEFIAPDGTPSRQGHTTKIISENEHEGSSYTIAPTGEWTKNRTYTWKKQSR